MTTPRVPAAARTRGAPTLREQLGVFCAHTNPKVMAVVAVSAVSARWLAGAWAGSDAVAVAILLGVQPLFEWVFHVYVLHYRPVRILGRTLDFELARKHREHHADPSDVDLVFVPLRSLLGAMVVFTGLALWLVPTRTNALTVIAMAAIALLAYEWTHFLIHSTYRPKTRLYRALWRAHRLHHFKNEEYWFGVTNPAADYLLRTAPDPAAVPTSPTARNLTGRPAKMS